MKLTDFDALTFDCYGTLIDWERGIATALGAWAGGHGIAADDDALLEAFSRHENRIEAEQPALLYPQVLARSLRAGINVGYMHYTKEYSWIPL